MDGDTTETVYTSGEDTHIMSERVQLLAASVYREFERLIGVYDEHVVKELTPLVVTVLESLEQALHERQECEVELELLRDDKEQLLTQYEREKQLRRNAEAKYLELDDSFDENSRQLQTKIESLESITRMFEIKLKNYQDQIARLEEKETETKMEYAKLHERYTDLFKAHADYIERTKLLGSNDRPSDGVLGNNKRLSSFFTRNDQQQAIESGFSETLLKPPPDSPMMTYQSPVFHRKRQAVSALRDASGVVCKTESNVIVETRTTGVASTETVQLVEHGTETAGREFSSLQPIDCEEQDQLMQKLDGYGLSASVYDEMISMDSDALGQIDDGSDIAGVSREVKNLIKENNELLATKNALNVVKDDLIAKMDELVSEREILREEIASLEVVREKLKLRNTELEEEVRKIREELEQKNRQSQDMNEDEDGLSAAQRKRFTRAEMARVLMERNQYKERLMELQESVRWAEMRRAMREQPEEKKRSSVWNIFSNLFVSSKKDSLSTAAGGAQSRRQTSFESPRIATRRVGSAQGLRVVRFREEQIVENEARKFLRAEERRWSEAETTDDQSRLQANGWLLPSTLHSSVSSNSSNASTGSQSLRLSVPLPVYCRPLSQDVNSQIWCAAAVDLDGWTGKLTHSDSNTSLSSSSSVAKNSVPGQTNVKKEETDGKQFQITDSIIWISTASRNGSEITVVDAKSLNKVLAKFYVSSSHVLCITGVPGATENDLPYTAGYIPSEPVPSSSDNETSSPNSSQVDFGKISVVQTAMAETWNKPVSTDESQPACDSTSDKSLTQDRIRSVDDSPAHCSLGPNRPSSALPTVWLGAQSGRVYVHSAVTDVDQRLFCIKMVDSVVDIVHIRGRIFIALANGTIAVFKRASDGQWDLTRHWLVTIGEPYKSVRCLCAVSNELVWCGYQNQIHVLNPLTLTVEKSFDAHPRRDSQVRQMVWLGSGVWVSIRLDSTLRLYHAQTYQHLQDIDVEPQVSKLIGSGSLGFSFIRIGCISIVCNRLWIGTSSGVIMCVPLFETPETGILTSVASCGSNQQVVTGPSSGRPGGIVRVYGGDNVGPSDVPVPYCNISQAQLSYHGLRDAVKFFVVVPGSPIAVSVEPVEGSSDTSSSTSAADESGYRKHATVVVVAGGEGYIDFRHVETTTETDDSASSTRSSDLTLPKAAKPDRGHLLAWQMFTSS